MNGVVSFVVLDECCIQIISPFTKRILMRANGFQHNLAANRNDIEKDNCNDGQFCRHEGSDKKVSLRSMNGGFTLTCTIKMQIMSNVLPDTRQRCNGFFWRQITNVCQVMHERFLRLDGRLRVNSRSSHRGNLAHAQAGIGFGSSLTQRLRERSDQVRRGQVSCWL
jgi:hypothetical protein